MCSKERILLSDDEVGSKVEVEVDIFLHVLRSCHVFIRFGIQILLKSSHKMYEKKVLASRKNSNNIEKIYKHWTMSNLCWSNPLLISSKLSCWIKFIYSWNFKKEIVNMFHFAFIFVENSIGTLQHCFPLCVSICFSLSRIWELRDWELRIARSELLFSLMVEKREKCVDRGRTWQTSDYICFGTNPTKASC